MLPPLQKRAIASVLLLDKIFVRLAGVSAEKSADRSFAVRGSTSLHRLFQFGRETFLFCGL